MHKIAPLTLLTSGIIMLATGCGQVGSPGLDEDAIAGLAANADCENCSYLFHPESLTGSVPSTIYDIDGNEITASTALVTGRFTGWSKGEAKIWTHPDDHNDSYPNGEDVDWDDPRAETRIIKMEFVVDSVIDAVPDVRVADTETVEVVAHTGHDPEQIAEGLIGLGESVVFLNGFDLWRIALDGGLVGDLHDDGSFTMPVLEHLKDNTINDRFAHLEIDATTIAELKEAAENPETIEL